MDWSLILRLALVAVAVLVVFVIIKNSLFIVQHGTVAVIKRWGKHHRVLSAGLHFRLMFGDTVQRRFSSQLTSLGLELRGDSGGQLPVQLSVELELRGVTDHPIVSTLAYEVEQPLTHLKVVAAAEVRELLLPLSFEQLLGDTALGDKIQHKLANVAPRCGYEIVAVRITGIRPEESVQQAIVANVRSATTREMEAAQSEHDAKLALEKANTGASVSAIDAKAARARMDEEKDQIISLILQLLAVNVPIEQINQIVTLLQYKAAVDSLADNSNAKIVLLPPGIQLDGDTSALMEMVKQV